jgi:SAM-dependent methyltransferase
VWGHVTAKFLDRLQVQRGWKCLDVGAGPGFVSIDLRHRVGEDGEVTALDPSQLYCDGFRDVIAAKGWNNVKVLLGRSEDASLPQRYFDFVFLRWVIAFVEDPEKFLTPLFAAMRPGAIIAIQDYYYEGLSLFPRGGAFDRMPDVVRAYYRAGGGDAYIAGLLPALLRKHGLRVIDYTPNCLAGGPGSGIMEWANRFFSVHVGKMIEKGVVSESVGNAMLADWNEHRKNPDALFFSPLVVDVAAQR